MHHRLSDRRRISIVITYMELLQGARSRKRRHRHHQDIPQRYGGSHCSLNESAGHPGTSIITWRNTAWVRACALRTRSSPLPLSRTDHHCAPGQEKHFRRIQDHRPEGIQAVRPGLCITNSRQRMPRCPFPLLLPAEGNIREGELF
jgi:hypothetical protein